MAEALEIKLPQSFFDALEEIKESSEERNDNRSDSDFYAKNILNGGNIQKVAPTFTSQLAKGYEDIGAAIFKGGTKIFFEYWDKIKKQEINLPQNKSIPSLMLIFQRKKFLNYPRQGHCPILFF